MKAFNGYVALAAMDANSDGVITAADQAFADLMVWVDSNLDGVSQHEELASLPALGIAELNLSAKATDNSNHGNVIGLVSSYTTVDGTTREMADVWFSTMTTPDGSASPPTVAAGPPQQVQSAILSAPAQSAVPTLAESLSTYMFQPPLEPQVSQPIALSGMLSQSGLLAQGNDASSGLNGALELYYANRKNEGLSQAVSALQNTSAIDEPGKHQPHPVVILTVGKNSSS